MILQPIVENAINMNPVDQDEMIETIKKIGAEVDIGSSMKSVLFGKEYPDRYFNVGTSLSETFQSPGTDNL